MAQITAILRAMETGDSQAGSRLMPLVYDHLRRQAAIQLGREKAGQTLEPTALVHEVYLRLLGEEEVRQTYSDRNHFFTAAARAMRHILIDKARRKQAARHGGEAQFEALDNVAAPAPDHELLALDEALERFSQQDPLKARLVELRYFAGLTSDEAAGVLEISPATADRHWAFARAWLRAELMKSK